jgi:hypothetical protein
MSTQDKEEISVLAHGDEGRFLEWQAPFWRVFDYYNYRHYFEESTINEHDLRALRKQFGLREDDPPDEELARMSPDNLRAIGQSPKRDSR